MRILRFGDKLTEEKLISKRKRRMQMRAKELAEQVVAERIDQIISKRRKKNEKRYKEQDAILSTLDPGTRKKFEDFVESLGEWNCEELVQVYRQAFFDGLKLAHKAF